MTGEERQRIVVGVDGSGSAQRALEWAMRQAALTGAVVDAVMAWEYPVNYGWVVADQDMQLAELAQQTLEKAIAAASHVAPDVVVRGHVLEQNPARALLDASEGADLLVVGSRGHGGFVGALLGSVSQHCVHHAPCPVLVVRDAADRRGGD